MSCCDLLDGAHVSLSFVASMVVATIVAAVGATLKNPAHVALLPIVAISTGSLVLLRSLVPDTSKMINK